jgi:hypothetical protein
MCFPFYHLVNNKYENPVIGGSYSECICLWPDDCPQMLKHVTKQDK